MVDASTTSKYCCDRIAIPIDKGLVTCRVKIPDHLLHDVTIIDRYVIKVLWNVGKGVGLNSIGSIPIGEVGNILEIFLLLDSLQELEQGAFGGVSPDHKIDEGILVEDCLMVIGGREPAQDDRDFWMKALNDLCYCQGSLDMGHPVEIDAKGERLFLEDESFDIEPLILKHLQGDIDNPYLHAMPLQIF
jgi:hypothetical protein